MKLTLKTQNYPLLISFVILNVSIFLTLYNTGSITFENVEKYFNTLKLKDGIFFSFISLFVIICGGLFANTIKEIVIFWKIENRLPGCQAFSKYAINDSRIDLMKLKTKYGNLPVLPTEQNKLWYQIFKKLSDINIDKTHKDFLLCRELTMLNIIMLSFTIPILIKYSATIGCSYLIFLIFQYLFIRYCAKNNAERLVVNVLALASSK